MNHNYPENMQHFVPAQADDEIDLRELFHALWKGKWIIILCTVVIAVGGVFFALSQPNTYKSEVLVAPTQGSSGGGLSGQLGGLAALAGVNIGGAQANDPKVEALAVLQSRKFIEAFIVKYDLLVPLMASKKWIEESNTLILNDELYNASSKEWLVSPKENKTLQPTLWEAHKTFKALLAVSEDKDNGMVTITITHVSAIIAQQWATLLVSELNEWMKQDELERSNKNLGYLKEKIEGTAIAELRALFFQMVEEQIKKRMLAEVQDEYVFKTIDPAVVAEEKAGPKRALICVLATLLGGMLGVAIVLIRFAFNKKESPEEPAAAN